jgi:nucleotide-binding universal stress UspA family protein
MKILVPTNFSENAYSALDYAADMAKELNASITLVHVIRPLMTSRMLPLLDKKEIEKNVVLELHEMQIYLANAYGVKSTVKVAIGDIADEIAKLAKVLKIDLIIMGTHGIHKLNRILFSNNTAQVISKSTIPVLALPPKAKFIKPKRIVFSTNYHASDIDDIVGIADFACSFGATISAVHIVNRFTDEDDDFDFRRSDYFSDLLQNKLKYDKIQCEEFQHSDVADGIRSFVEGEGADILALSNTDRNFMEKFFLKSLTNEFLFRIEIPILVFQAPTSHTNSGNG